MVLCSACTPIEKTIIFPCSLFWGKISFVKEVFLLEIRRQVFHLCFGTGIALFLYLDLINSYSLALLTILFGILILHWKTPSSERSLLKKMLSFFERDEHIIQFPGRGVFFFLLGATLVSFLFSQPIALASILILAVADAVCHLYGRFLGYVKIPKFPKKNLEGHVIGWILGALVALIFVPLVPALIASFIAMIFEIPEWKVGIIPLDDNLLIPIAAAGSLAMWNVFFPFL